MAGEIVKTQWWLCPKCGTVTEKAFPANLEVTVLSPATCGGCSKAFKSDEIYSGMYDVEELGGNRFRHASHSVYAQRERQRIIDQYISQRKAEGTWEEEAEKKWWQFWHKK